MVLTIIILTVTIHLFIGNKYSLNAIAKTSMTGIFLCNHLTSLTFFKFIGTTANTMTMNSGGSKGVGGIKT